MSRRLVDGKLPVRPANAKKAGAPSLLNQEMLEKIVGPLRMGVPITTTFAYFGVHYDLLRLWVIKGKEDPKSIYGELIRVVEKSVAEWELRDISVIEKHAMGAPAEYVMEPVRNPDGFVVMDGKKPLMQIARDADGNPVLKTPAIKSDWKAAMERLARRKGKHWRQRDQIDVEAVLTFTNEEREAKPVEAQTFEQKIAEAVKKLEGEY